MTVPEKRHAYEPAVSLVERVGYDPDMKRPGSTVAGGVLVLLRAFAGLLWLSAVALGWEGWVESLLSGASGATASDLGSDELQAGLAAFLAVGGIVFVFQGTLGVLILRGRNIPRMIVMFFSVLSISAAFTGWWLQGQDIRVETTLVTLALDILILLALSSRSAAAYARRNERR